MLAIARKKLTISDAFGALGRTRSHAGNVLKGLRGIDDEELHQLGRLLGSPDSDSCRRISEDQYAWLDRLRYEALLPQTPKPACAPQAHTAIDRLVINGKLVRLEEFFGRFPMLLASSGTSGPGFRLRTSRGTYWAFVEHQTPYWCRDGKRFQPYETTVLLKAYIDGPPVTLARLDQGPRGYRMRPGRVRLEITGLACTLGLAASLCQYLFSPFVHPDSVELSEIHLAVDIAAPSRFLMAFQADRSGPGILRKHQRHLNDLCNVGFEIGAGAGGFSLLKYDKRERVAASKLYDPRFDLSLVSRKPRGRAAFVPGYAENWPDVTRCEGRFRPPKLGLRGDPRTVLPRLLGRLQTVHVADLRCHEGPTLGSVLACDARFDGFVPQPPKLETVLRKQAETPDEPGCFPVHNHGEHCLATLLKLDVKPDWAEEAAQTLHAETRAELLRMSRRSGINLRAIVEEALPRLLGELDACLIVELSVQAQWDRATSSVWAA